MPSEKYSYSVTQDFPNAKVYIPNFVEEIQASKITVALDYIGLHGDNLDIWFKATLPSGDKTILDGGTTNPANGLIAEHNHISKKNDPTPVTVENAEIKTTIWKPHQDKYSRIYIFSCDFTKKETWYVDSSGASSSLLTNGAQSEFDLSHGSGNGYAIIDLSHGKITDEHMITTPSGESYVPIVKLDGVVQSERESFETQGGDYEIDYVAGKLKFFATPASGSTITADYYVSGPGHGPVILGGPPSGKIWTITAAEVQLSEDIIMNDTLMQNVIVDVPIFDASGNYITTLYDQKGAADAIYKTFGAFLDYTYGSYPIVPGIGGNNSRGLAQNTIIMRWDYLSAMELSSQINARIKVWTKHGRGFSGERATVTIYGMEHDE